MKSKVLIILAVAVCFAGVAQRAYSQDLAGTKWTTVGSESTNGGVETFEFKANGTVIVSDDWEDDTATWHQDGNAIVIEHRETKMGNTYLVWKIEAKRDRNILTGSRTLVASGKSRSWSARRST